MRADEINPSSLRYDATSPSSSDLGTTSPPSPGYGATGPSSLHSDVASLPSQGYGATGRERNGGLDKTRILYLTVHIMKPAQPVEWRQSGPGIWTPIPEGEMRARKGPVRKIASMTAERPTGLLAKEGKGNKSGAVRAPVAVRRRVAKRA